MFEQESAVKTGRDGRGGGGGLGLNCVLHNGGAGHKMEHKYYDVLLNRARASMVLFPND